MQRLAACCPPLRKAGGKPVKLTKTFYGFLEARGEERGAASGFVEQDVVTLGRGAAGSATQASI